MIESLTHITFRLYRKVRRTVTKYSTNPCPSSYPYISGDTFRSCADMIYDQTSNSVVPENVKNGTVIFVCTEIINEFFDAIHPKIRNHYVLITHNSDRIIDHSLASRVDEKIIKWYAMSDAVEHEKIVPIPAGLENKRLYNWGLVGLFKKYVAHGSERKNRILFGFNIQSNAKERQPAYDALIANCVADKIEGYPEVYDYLKRLSEYQFVAAPPGNAIESHRMWEAMYVGTVPIVKRSYMMEYFSSIGLPIWLIDDWHELDGLSEQELATRYNATMGHADNKALWMDYWLERIQSRT